MGPGYTWRQTTSVVAAVQAGGHPDRQLVAPKRCGSRTRPKFDVVLASSDLQLSDEVIAPSRSSAPPETVVGTRYRRCGSISTANDRAPTDSQGRTARAQRADFESRAQLSSYRPVRTVVRMVVRAISRVVFCLVAPDNCPGSIPTPASKQLAHYPSKPVVRTPLC